MTPVEVLFDKKIRFVPMFSLFVNSQKSYTCVLILYSLCRNCSNSTTFICLFFHVFQDILRRLTKYYIFLNNIITGNHPYADNNMFILK
jgi:hypothetical protein